MPKDIAPDVRLLIDQNTYADEAATVARLREDAALSDADRAAICEKATRLVRDIRGSTRPGMMEVFLAEYGLSTDEGIALMCLAEALLRVPDAETIDALIEDKIAPSDWGRHMGRSTSPLVNASTWALMLTGRVLDPEKRPGPAGHLRAAMKRLGEPVIRTAVGRAMREMGAQFVLGETIQKAMKRGAAQEAKGYTYSYDMLGEAARTEDDALRYLDAYAKAIDAIAGAAKAPDTRDNPGISVKLSALYPRYEEAQYDAVIEVLVPRLQQLCEQAAKAGIGLNIDAEESDRLSLSLDVIARAFAAPALAGWDGFGVVVQAYGLRASETLDWLYALAEAHDRRIMVRLVKGAYWDTEIKRAQVMGLEGFPVFTAKSHSDISYIANARKLLGMTDRIYPQFATHNAHTVAAVLHMAEGVSTEAYEFQRLHGMGETLHELVMAKAGTRCRIYAPVGAHRDLLAYLVRRLLENGANSSFVNQIVDEEVPPETVAADPFEMQDQRPLARGPELFEPERRNSMGFDLTHRPTLSHIDTARIPFRDHRWQAGPLLAVEAPVGATERVPNPAMPSDDVGEITWASPETVTAAAAAATPWQATPSERAAVLLKAADLYEAHFGEIFAILHREAGKTLLDAVAEIREAVDFLRYYAARADGAPPRGVFACISPWNFPLAIFTGQIAAALATGNAVLAKPAEQTPVLAWRAAQLLHEAGVPTTALQLLPGAGDVGAALTSCPQVKGVAFTGSTETAQIIHRSIAENLDPGTPLIAETGGLNAMIVDSTALPEQAVRAIVESAFQSAGQRCSALRCLYVQEDIAPHFLEMLTGAMDALRPGQPWELSTDLGPVIDAEAHDGIAAYVEAARKDGRLINQIEVPSEGHFIGPALIRVGGIEDLEREIFGPVLHVATFKATELDRVIDSINATGYGLTFGLQTRIDDRVQHVTERVEAGNLYVNRNQIGAIVGSQPFGGEGLSGTGPKAGGPLYCDRFRHHAHDGPVGNWSTRDVADRLRAALDAAGPGAGPKLTELPGPTGEANQYTTHARPPVLCLGPGSDCAAAQAEAIRAMGGVAVAAHGKIAPEDLTALEGISAAVWWGDEDTARAYRAALAKRDGPIVSLVTGTPDKGHARAERHVCIDTTASGGNAQLLGGNM
ncbi:MAG: bifunctional proline dehydrogenase/L-glutamate gamma-semialdehyde dehydrogenase PutA [Rhodobacteraceae bacterium]|jgi:RHH-type proline utilization regulon transcriptional repressor/proline dehydrogenase/delta 1-pyrroline-5-carboxylate dehydrogenase|uniref:Bifunctional protein PutA n=1 Tax=Salipiger profundus TaxID=1229727 RepID=A0A1U7D0T2_9RHOB|nr:MULTISPECIES: bifunctional proline dehydrogenase/L-glutamate gamma-semialdehyde dehydrogenase PutA [Salipiger]APX21742.1 delta-1-pyrroline-5-carboxylate dehydrogenase [Salipiger profundus]MAB04502.1 bifunctional proline dehydrogenase/L-glutamate gamma-semialdehyde dehydrogenase PutA [Paracoccaceae bacterium]GGA00228.1 bifunctional protein PutA [Salipiger profundus]SFC08802.1 L-proline dehydrogenase /delta-1-pyrroline-5-carboxylate dehydrogenase [Salipiger profundus]